MTSALDTDSVPENDKKKVTESKSQNKNRTEEKGKSEKKTKNKKGKETTSNSSDSVPETELKSKPNIKKKQAKAKEIDKTQAKRLVKPKRTVPKRTRKVVRAVKPKIEPRNIGVEVNPPIESCTDPACPFHGKLSVRGQVINCVVISSRMDKTAIVHREVKRYIPKYERYEKRTHKYAVHNPQCLNVQRGDMVKIMECRPLSKSKSFVVIEKQ
jgi:small subunit ribosomal protein S17